MEKEQFRSVIRFLFLDGKKREEIKVKMDSVYRDSSSSKATMRYWFNEFKCCCTSVYNEERTGPQTW